MSRATRVRRRESAFEDFVATHGAGLVRLAFVICGDRDHAQDAAQEALIRLYQRWSRVKDPLAYARQTTVNCTRDTWRAARREDGRQRAVEVLLSRREPDHPQEVIADRDALMSTLAALPHHQRAVIALRYGAQLTETETAMVLDIPVGTVKSRATAALTHMRVALDAQLILTDSEV